MACRNAGSGYRCTLPLVKRIRTPDVALSRHEIERRDPRRQVWTGHDAVATPRGVVVRAQKRPVAHTTGLARVARAGFEPAISALRGRCPWPLDERAIHGAGAPQVP